MLVVAVSPNYLEYLVKENSAFKFKIKGYGNFKEAIKGLVKTNASDIYGFCVVVNNIKEHEKSLLDFIKMCDMISFKSKKIKRFVFAIKDETNLITFLRKKEFNNLEFRMAKFSILTDMFIRKDIFGTIIESYLDPYLEDTTEQIASLKSLNTLEYIPNFPSVILKVFSEVKVSNTLKDTMIKDKSLDDLKVISEIYYNLRLEYIKKVYGDKINYKYLISLEENTEDINIRLASKLIREESPIDT